MNEQRFRELDQAWGRIEDRRQELEERDRAKEDELPADWPPMDDDPQSMTGD